MGSTTRPYVYQASITLTLKPQTCYLCGVVFGMEAGFDRERRDDHKTWYCPNGHPQVYTGRTREEQLAAELEGARAYSRHLEDQKQAAERSARAYKGVATRTKRRVANGVCPCCTRTFPDVAAHMSDKHPEYVADANGDVAGSSPEPA